MTSCIKTPIHPIKTTAANSWWLVAWCIVIMAVGVSSCKSDNTLSANADIDIARKNYQKASLLMNKDSSLFYLKEFEKAVRKHNYPYTNTARYYSNVSIYHADFGSLDSAIFYRNLAMNYVPDSIATSFAFGTKIIQKTNLALIYMKQNKNLDAILQLEDAIEMTIKYNYPAERLFAYSLLAEIYFDQREFKRAIEIGEEGKSSILKYWGEYPNEIARIDRFIGLSTVEDKDSNDEKKQEMMEVMIKILDDKVFESDGMDFVIASDIIQYFDQLLPIEEQRRIIQPFYDKVDELPIESSSIVLFTRISNIKVLLGEGKYQEAKDKLTPLLAQKDIFPSYVLETAYNVFKKTNDTKKALEFHELWINNKNKRDAKLYSNKLLETQSKFDVERMTTHSTILQERNDFIYKLLTISAFLLALSLLLVGISLFLFFKIKAKHRKLEEIDKNKNELFLILAHDLKGPMSTFERMSKRVAYLVKNKDFESLDKLSTYFENIGSSLKYSVYNLLDWSLSQREKFVLEKEEFDARVKIDLIVAELRYFLKERNISIAISPKDSQKIMVTMDLNSFLIAFRNILHNAIKQADSASEVEINIQPKSNHTSISILNTGKHIDQDILNKLKELISSSVNNFASMKMRDSGI